MRLSANPILLALMLLVTGCVPVSLHPLYTEEDLAYDPALVGQWAEEGSEESWTFTRSEDGKGYVVLYKEMNSNKELKEGRFEVHLLKVQGRMFLDLYPQEPDLRQNDFYKLHLVRVHSFLRVLQIEPSLKMTMPDYDWLKKLLEQNPGAIAHEKVDDGFVLTASPKELQAFLIGHEATEGAFGEPVEMKRRDQAAKP